MSGGEKGMDNYGKREGKKEKMESKQDGEIEITGERKKEVRRE